MLTTSEAARRLNITNSQVQDLVRFGYLGVADVSRTGSGSVVHLFAEEELDALDVGPALAEICERRRHLVRTGSPPVSLRWKHRHRAMRGSERVLAAIAADPDAPLLRAAFYLFHLNHYAKTYPEERDRLYALKNEVLQRMVARYPRRVALAYLVGEDRVKVWLCDECRAAARSGGHRYPDFLKMRGACSKCFAQVLEREYYSLVEFSMQGEECGFRFHLPRQVAAQWLPGLAELPRRGRNRDEARDAMLAFGRRVSRGEEEVVPMQVAVRELETFLQAGPGTGGPE